MTIKYVLVALVTLWLTVQGISLRASPHRPFLFETDPAYTGDEKKAASDLGLKLLYPPPTGRARGCYVGVPSGAATPEALFDTKAQAGGSVAACTTHFNTHKPYYEKETGTLHYVSPKNLADYGIQLDHERLHCDTQQIAMGSPAPKPPATNIIKEVRTLILDNGNFTPATLTDWENIPDFLQQILATSEPSIAQDRFSRLDNCARLAVNPISRKLYVYAGLLATAYISREEAEDLLALYQQQMVKRYEPSVLDSVLVGNLRKHIISFPPQKEVDVVRKLRAKVLKERFVEINTPEKKKLSKKPAPSKA
jgi:hypothetical protein